MSLIIHSLVTKGILGGAPGTKGFIFLELEQGKIQIGGGLFYTSGGQAYDIPKNAKKWIKIKFEYDEKTWEQTLLLDDNVEVKMDNLKIDLHEDFLNSEISEVELEHVEKIIDVKLIGFNHDVNILNPKITIKF